MSSTMNEHTAVHCVCQSCVAYVKFAGRLATYWPEMRLYHGGGDVAPEALLHDLRILKLPDFQRYRVLEAMRDFSRLGFRYNMRFD